MKKTLRSLLLLFAIALIAAGLRFFMAPGWPASVPGVELESGEWVNQIDRTNGHFYVGELVLLVNSRDWPRAGIVELDRKRQMAKTNRVEITPDLPDHLPAVEKAVGLLRTAVQHPLWEAPDLEYLQTFEELVTGSAPGISGALNDFMTVYFLYLEFLANEKRWAELGEAGALYYQLAFRYGRGGNAFMRSESRLLLGLGNTIPRMMKRHDVPPDVLKKWIEVIGEEWSAWPAYEVGLRQEWQGVDRVLVEGRAKVEGVEQPVVPPVIHPGFWGGSTTSVMRKHYRNLYANLIDCARDPACWLEDEEHPASTFLDENERRGWYGYDPVGRYLAPSFIPRFNKGFEEKILASCQGFRVWMAIEVFRKVNGILPENLKDLEPEILAEIPQLQIAPSGFEYTRLDSAESYRLRFKDLHPRYEDDERYLVWPRE